MNTIRLKVIDCIEKKTVFIAISLTLAIAYYINPLYQVDVMSWDRTFCSALMNGISIDSRIGNFYKLFLFYIPLIFVSLLLVLVLLLKYRPNYRNHFFIFSSFLTVGTLASYISRYTTNASEINSSPLIEIMLFFFIILSIIAVLDKEQELAFRDHVCALLISMISMLICFMLFHSERTIKYLLVIGILMIGCSAFIIYVPIGKRIFPIFRNYLYVLMWLPAIIRGLLEGIYFLTEKGRGIERYYTHVSRASVLIAVGLLAVVWFLRKKKLKLQNVGYIGAIVSFSVISTFSFSYQYTFSYSSFANIYELGNNAVAMDTYLYGKLPVIDYFSAHALGDVWTELIYCFIHGDVNGILVNPYGGLSIMASFIILYFVIKQFFDEEIAVLFVLLFPGSITGIKFTSVCMITIAMLTYICRKPFVRAYLFFWVCALISAFTTYDEGISLGIACIFAYIIGCLFLKEWNNLRNFMICGAVVGGLALACYVEYALITGVPLLGRIKEWLSVSVGSSSSWATANFGDQTSFAFLVSYFIVPLSAIVLLVITVITYIRSKKNLTLVLFTIAFSLAEILYMTRTVVYHNLAVCAGSTGVLLNYIHWTVAAYVLYRSFENEKSSIIKISTFMGTMMAVIIFEATAVTGYWPSTSSSLMNLGFFAAESWNLRDGTTINQGQPRIVYDDSTTDLVNSFKQVFDTLMTDDQTYLDFANVTSMYLLTGRKRPCYVGQSPSLLTDLYSQECYLSEIAEYDCPLAVVGTSKTSYLQQMIGIPHNIRYYKIAEYIYNNYRPLVTFGEFVIWCEKESYDAYCERLKTSGLAGNGNYVLVDYGYDFTTAYFDKNGNIQWEFKPYHSYDLAQIPYVWANHDDYEAINNTELLKIEPIEKNKYVFDGSRNIVSENGNYLAFEVISNAESSLSKNIVLYDSNNEGAKIQFFFTIKPGTNQYLIRVSEDYFWDVFNIDTIVFGSHDAITIDSVRILEGD